MKYAKVATALVLAGGLALPSLAAASSDNKITPSLQSVEVMHNGKKVTIARAADKDAHIPEAYDKTLGREHVSPMDFTGRPMRGMVYVEPEGLKTNTQLRKWVKLASDFAGSLPPK